MNREQMIEKVAEVIWCRHGGTPTDPYDDHRLPIPLDCFDDASAVVDAILPQVTTVEELDALPAKSILIGTALGHAEMVLWQPSWQDPQEILEMFGPLTVVWQP